MSTPSCASAPGPLFRLATSQKHQFPLFTERRLPADPQAGRAARVERPCVLCGTVKITQFLADSGAERLWRRAGETAESGEDPGCGPKEGDR